MIRSIARLAMDPRSDHPHDRPKILRIKITDPRRPAKTRNDPREHRKWNDGLQTARRRVSSRNPGIRQKTKKRSCARQDLIYLQQLGVARTTC